MELLNKTYLKFIKFKNISGYWDVKRLSFNSSFSSSYEMVRLGEIINPISNKIKKENYDGSRKIVSKITFNNGKLYLRDDNKSGMDVYITYPGNLLVSNINFHQGALAINNFGEEIVCSTHYQPYEINKKLINEEYLILTLRSEEFKNYVVNQKSNGIKTESKFSFIKDLEIPLPSIYEQNKIVEEYNKKLQDSVNAEIKSKELEKEIESYLIEELGINLMKTEKVINLKTFKLIDFFDTEKWGTKYLLNGLDLGKILKSNIFQMYKLKDLLQINPQTSFDKSLDISFIPMKYVSDEYGEILHKDIINGTESNGYTKFKEGDLIWSRITPCMQNGKSAIVKNLENGIGCGSTEYHVLRNNNEKVNLEFIYIILRLEKILKYAMNYFTGSAGQQRVPKEFLEDLQIPLPPLEIQEKIVKRIGELKEEIKRLKSLSEELKENSRVEFEKEIFS